MSILVKPDKPLATVNRILERHEIENADLIESVRVLGWNCVVKKGEFNVGDLCVYFTIGSVFPVEYSRVDFLGGKPLKTKKMRGALSQGLVAPLSWLEDFGCNIEDFSEGQDVTDLFNLKKFVEAEESAVYSPHARMGRAFPSYVPKTDEERVQNIPHIIPFLVGKNIVVTRKEDGCSATYIFNQGEFLMCSRNYVLEDMNKGNQHYFQVAEGMNLREKMESLGRNLALQGEIVGPKIGNNRLKVPALMFRVFNVVDLDTQEYLAHSEVVDLCNSIGLDTVPVVYEGTVEADDERFNSVAGLLSFAESIEYGPNNPAEGVVIKGNYRYPLKLDDIPMFERESLKKLSFKAISNKYLLKHNL